MTDARIAALVSEALISPTAPSRRVAALVSEALVVPSNPECRVASLVVEVLIPLGSTTPPYGTVAAGASTSEVFTLHDDGQWRAFRPVIHA